MKTKVIVVLTKTRSGMPNVFVELVNKAVEAENSPNKKWTIKVPKDNPVGESEFNLMLQQLGLNGRIPQDGHRVICDAEAYYTEFDDGSKSHYLLVQVCKDIRRLFSFDRFHEISIREGAKFHFEFEKKIKDTDVVTLTIPEDIPAKQDSKK